jgi:hypothetical protein
MREFDADSGSRNSNEKREPRGFWANAERSSERALMLAIPVGARELNLGKERANSQGEEVTILAGN